jgi:hypothetical protein
VSPRKPRLASGAAGFDSASGRDSLKVIESTDFSMMIGLATDKKRIDGSPELVERE